MADRGSEQRQIASLWGSIQRSVAQRETTAQLWSRVRTELNLPDTGPTGIARATFNDLRSKAAGMRNASERFMTNLGRTAATGMDRAVDSSMIAQAPWSRPQAEQNAVPIYQVNFQMTMVDENGNEDEGWFTTMFRGALPPTVEELADQVELDAEMMAGTYGKGLSAVGSIQILAV